jgi:hypothetical protein
MERETLVVVVVASETEKAKARRSLSMLRGQITLRSHHCEECVVSRLPPQGFELQISRLPGKGGYSTRPSGTTSSVVILVWRLHPSQGRAKRWIWYLKVN